MAAFPLTLDVPEVQVLVHYPNDGGGMFWHHRVLLHRVDAGDWICLTPDLEFQRHDLSVQRHRVLERASPFPGDILAEIYAHDPLSRAQLQTYKRQSKIMAAVLGDGAIDELETVAWVVADPVHSRFGEVIDSQLLANEATGTAFTVRGVVLLDGEELFVERITLSELDDWKAKKGAEIGDIRLLCDHKDNAGRRKLDLAAAVALMREPEDKDFPVAGTRSSKEFHISVAEGPGNFTTYHSEWLRLSGVSGRNSAAHVHRHLCEILRLMHSYEQLDCSALASGETICRWLIQTELAVERSPQSPDYSGLDIVAGTATLPDGRASTQKFTEWVTGRLRERASIWKQERLFKQERRLGRGSRGGYHQDEDDSDEDGDPKKRKKKKNKKTKPADKDNTAGPSGAGGSK